MRSSNRRRYSSISRNILGSFLRMILILFVALTLGYFLASYICRKMVWYPDDQFYYLLKSLEYYAPQLFLIVMVVSSADHRRTWICLDSEGVLF